MSGRTAFARVMLLRAWLMISSDNARVLCEAVCRWSAPD
jgi:hypothetical protein